MAFDRRAYNRDQMRKRRAKQDPKRNELLTSKGKCIRCEMLLSSAYHTDCTLSTPPGTQNSGQ